MSKLLRGVELVDAVMAKRRADGEPLVPASPEAIAGEQFELSPALRRWLENDSEMFTLGAPQSFAEMIKAEYGEEWIEAFGPVVELLTEPVVLFEGWGSDSRRMIYLGSRDASGEYTVITVDNDDGPYACVNGPVDVWLAQQSGFLEDEHVYGAVPAEYEAVRKEHADSAMGGFVEFADFELSETHGGGETDDDDDDD
jgi:hypothetical protein